MAPLRNNRTTNRSARSQIDHDAMEGLPVRQWRKAPAVVNTAPLRESSNVTKMRSAGWKELPMPRGSELYSPMSQALLRAARMGQVNRPPPPPLEDEKERGEDDVAEGEVDIGFVAVKWSQVPKEIEEPEMEFLAKRRKGLPSVYGGISGSLGVSAPMRKTKVRKVNEDGSRSVFDVFIPEGTIVDGEVVEADEDTTEAPAPGTVVEGVGVVNAEGVVVAGDQVTPTPPRRRPPPPKRKAKGPGRGRRKRPSGIHGVAGSNDLLHPSSVDSGGSLAITGGSTAVDQVAVGTRNGDIEMGDDLTMQDGEEGSEDDDEDGEEGEDGDREEGELSPTPEADAPGSLSDSPLKLPLLPIIEPVYLQQASSSSFLDVTSTINREPSSSPDLPLAAGQTTMTPLSAPMPLNMEPTMGIVSPLDIESPAQNTPPIATEPCVEIAIASPPIIIPDHVFGTVVDSVPDPVTVEDQNLLSSAAAELPPKRNAHDGSAAPDISKVDEVGRMSEGEDDIFGSLEKHLNGKI